jgi:ferrochelatase
MRLENTLALINGELINSPFVNNFTNIVFEAKSVRRGDLFIAFDESAIEEAIFNGAYGVIFDKPTQITDSEIAWIKVQNLEDALKRLLRFELINKEIVVYECDEIILKLALQVITEVNFIVLYGDIKTIFKNLSGIESSSTILFCPLLSTPDIFTNIKSMPTVAVHSINMIEQTLFETSFIYDNTFYERQLISPFFMPYLEQLLYLFKSLKINFRLKKFIPLEHFEAVFTNKNFEIKEFGTSDKVLIFEKNTSLIVNEILFLQNQATWAKIIYIIPISSKRFIDSNHNNIFVYRYKDEIKNILKSNSFHFALVVGVDKSILDKPLAKQTQLTLDFNK